MNAVWVGDALVSWWKYVLSTEIDGQWRRDGQETALRDCRGTVFIRWAQCGRSLAVIGRLMNEQKMVGKVVE